MRWKLWLVAAGLPVAAVYGQTCPAVNFLQGNIVTAFDNLHASGLQRQPDGSLTRWRYQTYAPYLLDDSTANYQSVLLNCSAAGARTFKNPPGWVAVADRLGVPTQSLIFANLLGNNTPVGLAIVPPNGSPTKTLSLLVEVPNPDGSVKSQNFYAVPASPAGILVADFNNDGKDDVVVLGYGSNGAWTNTIAVYLGNGDGTLQAPSFYSGNQGTDAAVAYDFNGDKKLDLAVVNAVSGDVSILLGQGNGTFAPAVNYPAAKGAIFIAAGDFNGDGHPDVVVGGANFLSMLLGNGNGNGTFNSAIKMTEPFSVSGMAVGDFNNDGKLDLAVSDSADGTVSVLLGDGTGRFSTEYDYMAGYQPGNLYAMDLDGDGNLDVVLASGHPDVMTANEYTDTIAAFFGRGDGTLIGPPAYWTGSGVNALAVADFNGDGKPDIAVASGELWILLSSGNGNFKTPVPISLGSGVSASGIAAGDFRGVGKQDLVVGDFKGSGIYVLLGNGDGTFQPPVKYGVGGGDGDVTAVAVADFRGNGKLDIAVCGSNYGSNSTAGILLGNGDGTFQSFTNLSGTVTPVSLTVGDFNNDGKPDLAIADQGTWNFSAGALLPTGSAIAVYLGKGNGSFQSPVNYTAGIDPSFIVAVDVNGDHTPDLIVGTLDPDYNTNYQSDVAVLLGNANGTFKAASYIATGEAPNSIAVADFNGDGKPDLAVAHCCGQIYATYMLGNGDGSFQPEVDILSAVSPSTVAAADLIGNGKPDLIVGSAEYYESSVAILLNLATVLQSIAVTPSDPSLVVGTTQQFTATGTYSDNTTQNLTGKVTWASATARVATISTGGLATGAAVGTSTVSATLGAVTGSTLLTVTPLSACDVVQTGAYSVADVQRMVNEALGGLPAANDLNDDGVVNVVDVQIVVNAILGLGCTA